MFPYFHISTIIQAQCVQNIAASCSTITATYRCNRHTNLQTLQPHKQFTIQTVRTDSLHFPCTHSNQILSLKSPYTADLNNSQKHTSGNVSSIFPILSALRHCIFCTRFSIQTAVCTLRVRQDPVFLPSGINSYYKTKQTTACEIQHYKADLEQFTIKFFSSVPTQFPYMCN